MTPRKISLEQKIDALTSIVEKGLAAVAEDISKLATKDQVFALHTQVNSIETELRSMKHTKLQSRVADLEEEVFKPMASTPARRPKQMSKADR
jgi:hypothetical protein